MATISVRPLGIAIHSASIRCMNIITLRVKEQVGKSDPFFFSRNETSVLQCKVYNYVQTK